MSTPPPSSSSETRAEEAVSTSRPRQLRLLQVANPITARLGVEVFAGLPQGPGVYFFYDAMGKLLYIGQSLNLRARVSSYRHVTPERHPRRILRLVHRIARIEWQTCETAAGAIELERGLLLQHRPPFNRAGTWQPPPWDLRITATQDHLHLTLSRSQTPAHTSALKEPAGMPATVLSPSSRGPAPLNLPALDISSSTDKEPPPAEEASLRTLSAFPLPRAIHATLCRCLMKLHHPHLPLAHYPAGLLNFTAPLEVRLPFPGQAPGIADLLTDFLSGSPEALLHAMEALLVEAPPADLDQHTGVPQVIPEPCSLASYWSAQVEMLQNFAAKKLLSNPRE